MGNEGYLRRATVQVVVHELVHEAEPAEARAVLALRGQRAQQRQALLGARQRAAVARAAALCAPCSQVLIIVITEIGLCFRINLTYKNTVSNKDVIFQILTL